ncbi:MAG TPA: PAS domain-containing protein [Polyangiaceae bacterium]|jgi:nitrogen fixation/metabolism regulation signal transduction histidine kinase|nr:PAS domain-containing protein [Polyangiaceae bacterium]
MASIPEQQQSGSRVGESGIFELRAADRSPAEAFRAEPFAEEAFAEQALHPERDPVVQAFGEIRSLNTQLQHANDALHGVNEALRARVEQLRLTALDLEQMLDGLELGVVLLDSELTLRHFNAMAAQFLALDDADIGGNVSGACRGLGLRLAEWCADVLRSGKRVRRSFQSAIGEPLTLQLRRARVDGELRLILVFSEVSEPR